MAKLDQQRIDAWRADNAELRRQRTEDKSQYEHDIRDLRGRLTMLETEQQTAKVERVAIVRWARAVVDVLRTREIPYPPPPVGLIDTNPEIPRMS